MQNTVLCLILENINIIIIMLIKMYESERLNRQGVYMKRNTILLVCSDEEFVASVEGSLAKNILETYRLEFITDIAYLKAYLTKPHSVDVLIIEEKLFPIWPQNQTAKKVFVITETDKVGANLISKYLGAQGIIKLLGPGYMSRVAGGEQIRTRIHDIVTMDNIRFKNVASLAIAAQLAKFGKKVLYICAENMQLFNEGLYADGKAIISREEQALAINLAINGDVRGIDSFIQKGDFDYVPQFNHFLSSYGLNANSIFALAEAIAKLEMYDEIVVEHPFGFSQESVSRLEKSKSIVIISGQGKDSCERLKILFDNTREVFDNCVLVCYPYIRTEYSYFELVEGGNDIICEIIENLNEDCDLRVLVENRIFRRTAEAVL